MEKPLIDDPLAWQAEIDNQPLSLNMNGSSRFWRTVQSLLERDIIRFSAPECFGMVIHLKDNVWLELKGNDETGWIDYRFVSQAEVEKEHAWAFWAIEGATAQDE